MGGNGQAPPEIDKNLPLPLSLLSPISVMGAVGTATGVVGSTTGAVTGSVGSATGSMMGGAGAASGVGVGAGASSAQQYQAPKWESRPKGIHNARLY